VIPVEEPWAEVIQRKRFGHEVEVEVNLRPTVSRPVCLGVGNPSGTRDQFFFYLRNFL
jgi:hypothetical protein